MRQVLQKSLAKLTEASFYNFCPLAEVEKLLPRNIACSNQLAGLVYSAVAVRIYVFDMMTTVHDSKARFI